ncbi:hypothetical protein [Clostridium faecium]
MEYFIFCYVNKNLFADMLFSFLTISTEATVGGADMKRCTWSDIISCSIS